MTVTLAAFLIPPPLLPAELPLIVLFVNDRYPCEFNIPPPMFVATLVVIELEVMEVVIDELAIPPPEFAWLPLMVEMLTINLAETTSMPPPAPLLAVLSLTE